MTEPPPIFVVRHGETQWSRERRHTGRSDIALTVKGEEQARALASRLPLGPFARVLTSPSARARDTARLAGFSDATVVCDLAEWDYGDYEGQTTAEIRALRPGWNLFRDGCPNGEDAAMAGTRADRIISVLRADSGPTLLFSSAHFIRVLGARWAGLSPQAGAAFALDIASISILGTEHDDEDPVIRLWNSTA